MAIHLLPDRTQTLLAYGLVAANVLVAFNVIVQIAMLRLGMNRAIASVPRNLSSYNGKVLVMVRGLPGSGKTILATLFRKALPKGVYLSTLDLNKPEVHISTQNFALRYFTKDRPVIVDDCNPLNRDLEPYVGIANKIGYKVLVVEPNTYWAKCPLLCFFKTAVANVTEIEKMLATWEPAQPVSPPAAPQITITPALYQAMTGYRCTTYQGLRYREGKAWVVIPKDYIRIHYETLLTRSTAKPLQNAESYMPKLETHLLRGDHPYQALFAEKLNHCKKVLKGLGSWHVLYSIEQLFILWAGEMLDEVRAQDPEHFQKDGADIVFIYIALWANNERHLSLKKVRELFELYFPDDTSILCKNNASLKWKEFFDLLTGTKLRSSDLIRHISICELRHYLNEQTRKQAYHAHYTFNPHISLEFNLTEHRQIWEKACQFAHKNWARGVVQVRYCLANYKNILSKNAYEKLSLKDQNYFIRRLLERWEICSRALGLFDCEMLKDLKKLEVGTTAEIAENLGSIFRIRYFLASYSGMKAFPTDTEFMNIYTGEFLSKQDLDDPKACEALFQEMSFFLLQMHSCLKVYGHNFLVTVSVLYNSIVPLAKLEAQRNEVAAQGAPSVAKPVQEVLPKTDAFSRTQVKRIVKRVKPEKKKLAALAPAVRKARAVSSQEPVARSSPMPVERLPYVRMDSYASYRSVVYSDGPSRLVAYAAHGDLLRQNIHAIQTLIKRCTHFTRHQFNLERLAILKGSLLIETALNFSAAQQNPQFEMRTHNLLLIYDKHPTTELKQIAQEFYCGTYWGHFTRAQAKRYEEKQFGHREPPYHLKRLETLSTEQDGSFVKIQGDLDRILEAAEQVAESSYCKPVQRACYTNTIGEHTDHECYTLDILISDVEELVINGDTELGGPWLRQMHDDLVCLDSTLELLHTPLSIDEYVLLFGHCHWLMHAIVQSAFYALREVRHLPMTQEHDLVPLLTDFAEHENMQLYSFLSEWLKKDVNSRYPLSQLEIQTPLHRIQLETIAMAHDPALLEQFQMRASGESDTVLSRTLNWSPYLKKVKTPEEQKHIITSSCYTLCELLSQEIIPLLTQHTRTTDDPAWAELITS